MPVFRTSQLDGHVLEGNGVGEGDELGDPFRRLDAGQPGRVQDVALGDPVGPDEAQGGRAELDEGGRRRLPPGHGLGPDVHHLRLAFAVDVAELGHGVTVRP